MKNAIRFVSILLCMVMLIPCNIFSAGAELPEGLWEEMKENFRHSHASQFGYPNYLELRSYYGEFDGYHIGVFDYKGAVLPAVHKIVIRNHEFSFANICDEKGFFAYKDGEFEFYDTLYPNNKFTRIIDNLSEEEFDKLAKAAGAYRIYSDVDYKNWYGNAIKYCDYKDYIKGIGNNNFNPDGELTREQFVTILARVAGADFTQYTETDFTDVKVDSWYGPSVIWAEKNGYVNGIGNSKFGVGKNIDRESLATLFYRYAEKQGLDISEKADFSGYTDAAGISTWAKDGCAWAVKCELLTSTDKTQLTLSPKMTVTRAQAAKIFMSYDNIE